MQAKWISRNDVNVEYEQYDFWKSRPELIRGGYFVAKQGAWVVTATADVIRALRPGIHLPAKGECAPLPAAERP